jgi:hypothetical protein
LQHCSTLITIMAKGSWVMRGAVVGLAFLVQAAHEVAPACVNVTNWSSITSFSDLPCGSTSVDSSFVEGRHTLMAAFRDTDCIEFAVHSSAPVETCFASVGELEVLGLAGLEKDPVLCPCSGKMSCRVRNQDLPRSAKFVLLVTPTSANAAWLDVRARKCTHTADFLLFLVAGMRLSSAGASLPGEHELRHFSSVVATALGVDPVHCHAISTAMHGVHLNVTLELAVEGSRAAAAVLTDASDPTFAHRVLATATTHTELRGARDFLGTIASLVMHFGGTQTDGHRPDGPRHAHAALPSAAPFFQLTLLLAMCSAACYLLCGLLRTMFNGDHGNRGYSILGTVCADNKGLPSSPSKARGKLKKSPAADEPYRGLPPGRKQADGSSACEMGHAGQRRTSSSVAVAIGGRRKSSTRRRFSDSGRRRSSSADNI